MAHRGSEFNFFQDIYVRIDIRIDISISIRPMTTKFDKQVYLQDLPQMRLIKQVLVRSRDNLKAFYLYYQSAYGHQTWQDGNLPWYAPAHKVHMTLWSRGLVRLSDKLKLLYPH